MRNLKVASLIIFIISLFITVDLGINCLGVGISELQDGVSYNSILQSSFGLLESLGVDSHIDFFNAFKISAWISSFILIVNISLNFTFSEPKRHDFSRYR